MPKEEEAGPGMAKEWAEVVGMVSTLKRWIQLCPLQVPVGMLYLVAYPYVHRWGQSNLDADLLAAIHKGDISNVRRILDRGCDVNARLLTVRPLGLAAADGFAPIVRLLIDRGADLNARDDKTALQWATEGHHRDCIL